jgi:hypothetical protein
MASTRVGNLRTLELKDATAAREAGVLACEFLDKMSGKAVESRHTNGTDRWRPALRLALLPPVLPHKPKTNSIVWLRISRSSGVIELMFSAFRFRPD